MVSSPSFSHCELSVGVYTTLIYLLLLGRGGLQEAAWRAGSPQPAQGQSWELCLLFPGSTLCSLLSSLAQNRSENL